MRSRSPSVARASRPPCLPRSATATRSAFLKRSQELASPADDDMGNKQSFQSEICPSLMAKGKCGGIPVKNRMVLAPLTRARCDGKHERIPGQHHIDYYTQRASAGLVISEGTSISPLSIGWNRNCGIYTDAQIEGWKKVTDSVHKAGGKIYCQLWFIGRAGHSSFMKEEAGCDEMVAPSAIAIVGDGVYGADGVKHPHEVPRALETSEIPGIVAMYGTGAANAKKAGFDGVEIHAANGYIIDQFLQTFSNSRTDKYGGPKENRYQILKEVVAECKKHWSADRIGVRISPNGAFNGMGSSDNPEMFKYVAEELNKENIGYLHMMDGLAFGYHEKAPALELADIRPLFKNTIIGNCGYTMETAEARIKEGNADMIAFGRPYLANPDLVERFAKGWKLADVPDPSTWFSGADPWAGPKGYSDYPAYAGDK